MKFEKVFTGDLLRKEVMSATKRGVQLFKFMEKGEFVPAEIVLDILSEVREDDQNIDLVY